MATRFTLKIISATENVDENDVGNALLDLGLQCREDFVTIFPLSRVKHYEIQFRSQQSLEKFEKLHAECEKTKALFRINRTLKSIMITRVWGDMSYDELENLLFPPILGPVDIVSKNAEQMKTKDGNKLWYTGRRFYQLRVEEFNRIKHILPTHLVCADHKMYVNFDRS